MGSTGETVWFRKSSCNWGEQFFFQEVGRFACYCTCASSCQPGGVSPWLAAGQASSLLPGKWCSPLCKLASCYWSEILVYFFSFNFNVIFHLLKLISAWFSLQAYSPLGSPGTTWIKDSNVLTHPVVIMVAEKLGKTPAQVALRWGIQMGHSVLPKSTTEARIKQNFELFDWSIPEELMAKFSEIEQASSCLRQLQMNLFAFLVISVV